MASTKKDKGKGGGGTAVAEKPTTQPITPTEGQSTIEWPTSTEERQAFEAKMEAELSSDAGLLGQVQRHYDETVAQIEKLSADAAVYKGMLDHFGSR
jgi:hypothetical protein